MLTRVFSRLRENPVVGLALVSAICLLIIIVLNGGSIIASQGNESGFAIPADVAAVIEAQGVALPDGIGVASGITPPPDYLIVLPIIGALIALGASVWILVRPAFDRNGRLIILMGGIVSATYFAYVARIQPAINDLFGEVTISFWLMLLATLVLLVQVVIDGRPDDGETGYLRVDEAKISGRVGGGVTSINLVQNLSVAFDALLANKLRALLTMLGVIIGVGSIVALLAVGQGAQDSVTENIGNLGTNLVTVSPAGFGANLFEDDVETIETSVPGITAVLPEYSGTLSVKSDLTTDNLQVFGVTPDYAVHRSLEAQVGRFIDIIDYDENARVAVVGTTVVEDFFDGENPIGETIRVNNQTFEIIGVLAEQDSAFGQDPNARIYVPLSTSYRYLFNARAVASNDRRVTSMTVVVEDPDTVDAAITQIQNVLRQQHDIEIGEDDDFRVTSQGQLLETLSSVTETFTVLLGALAGVSLVVGGIGIMNISLVSVTERTKEIGLRKAVGGKKYHILQQFLIETVVLSLIGGVLGVIVGAGIAYIANMTGLLNASITWQSIALGLGSSFITGIFFGVYPANRAAALEPIEALRYE